VYGLRLFVYTVKHPTVDEEEFWLMKVTVNLEVN
jgi:hypothetical protein